MKTKAKRLPGYHPTDEEFLALVTYLARLNVADFEGAILAARMKRHPNQARMSRELRRMRETVARAKTSS